MNITLANADSNSPLLLVVKYMWNLSHHVIVVVLLQRLLDGVEDEYNLASVLQAAS